MVQEIQYFRREMYLKSKNTQNSLTSKKCPDKYDISFTQEVPTDQYVLQTKPTYEFQKSLVGRLP